HLAKFVRTFADVHAETVRGLTDYTHAVRHRDFPAAQHTYTLNENELDVLRARFPSDAPKGPA
ncbi:MAG TPA: hypothetical protein VGK53_08215, partial [Propionicimonas sp.]